MPNSAICFKNCKCTDFFSLTNTSATMKVVIINRSDTAGGAAIASHRLLHALIDCGVEANMLVIDKQTDDDAVSVARPAWKSRYTFLAERLGIALRTGFDRTTLFKIDTATRGLNLAAHPLVKQADVVALGWVNQGMLSLRGIERLTKSGKPIVWVMHDMWNATGICHHAFDCKAFHGTCKACPLLGAKGNDLSTATQARKAALYASAQIRFVAVSHWLEDVCRESSLMRESDITVIPNPFPIEDFEASRKCDSYRDLPTDKHLIVMGARRLDEEIKGFDRLVAGSKHIAEQMPGLASQLHLVLYGDMRDATLLEQLALPFTYLGTVGPQELSEVYRHCDIVLSTSQFENLPGTLIEGQACGCVPVTFGRGGQVDIVDHLSTGYIARYADIADLAQGIRWAVETPPDREFLHREVERKFAAANVAKRFIHLFNEAL